MDFLNQFVTKLKMCQNHTYLEAKRRVKDVIEDDGLTVKGQANSMAAFEDYVKVLESRLTKVRKENEKMMFLFEK
jgi:hypothetical protein